MPTDPTDPPTSPRSARSPRPRWRRVLLAVGSAVVLPAWIEVAVETTGIAPDREAPIQLWSPEQDQSLQNSEGEFRAHPRWLWEPRPGAMVHGAPINPSGYRGTEYPRSREGGAALRIATIGDSSTYGFGVDENDCWSRRLEAVLRENGVDVEVLNFGVVGFTIRQGVELYRGRIHEYRPDIVIEAFGAVNDSVATDQPFTDLQKVERLSNPWMALRFRLGRFSTFRWLERVIGAPDDEEAAPATATPRPRQAVTRVPLDDFDRAIRELDALVKADGGTLFVVVPPRANSAEEFVPASGPYPKRAMETALDAGIPYVDILTPFRAAETRQRVSAGTPTNDGAPKQTLFLDPWHPTEKGHDAYARLLAIGLHRAGLIPGAPTPDSDETSPR